MKLSTDYSKSILYVVTDDWYFFSHRLPIAISAQNNGFKVFVACNVKDHGEKIRDLGFTLVPINQVRSSLNPFQLFIKLLEIIALVREIRPSIIQNVSAKPIILGTIASIFSKETKVVNQLPGLGVLAYYRFSGLKKIASALLFTFVTQLFKRIQCWVVLQNSGDFERISAACEGSLSRSVLIRGSGVDSNKFLPTPSSNNPKMVALVARMISSKGISDFVNAAKIIWNHDQTYQFILVGDTDHGNSNEIPEEKLREYSRLPNVQWWGHIDDVRKVWDKCCIACLPTKYPEGLPMSLLEAASCGRPIVATGVPGCLEIARDGINGIIVSEGDSAELATALMQLLEDADLCEKYGACSRDLVLGEFDKTIIESQTLALYEEVLDVGIYD